VVAFASGDFAAGSERDAGIIRVYVLLWLWRGASRKAIVGMGISMLGSKRAKAGCIKHPGIGHEGLVTSPSQ